MRLPLAALCCTIPSASGTVTVSNVVPRTDSSGAYMGAHDGNTIQYIEGGPYFWRASSIPQNYCLHLFFR